jgi:NTP pyrophosphatase (non-canonical NTP hydrolase)
MSAQSISDLAIALRAFAAEREWDQFHSPRNLAAALSVEASEVLEHFQWKTDEQSRSLSREQKEEVAMELADVFIYLVRLADRLDVDLLQAAREKMQVNAQKYPVEVTRGTIKKIP